MFVVLAEEEEVGVGAAVLLVTEEVAEVPALASQTRTSIKSPTSKRPKGEEEAVGEEDEEFTGIEGLEDEEVDEEGKPVDALCDPEEGEEADNSEGRSSSGELLKTLLLLTNFTFFMLDATAVFNWETPVIPPPTTPVFFFFELFPSPQLSNKSGWSAISVEVSLSSEPASNERAS